RTGGFWGAAVGFRPISDVRHRSGEAQERLHCCCSGGDSWAVGGEKVAREAMTLATSSGLRSPGTDVFEPLATLRGFVMNLLTVSILQTSPPWPASTIASEYSNPSSDAAGRPIRFFSSGPLLAPSPIVWQPAHRSSNTCSPSATSPWANAPPALAM